MAPLYLVTYLELIHSLFEHYLPNFNTNVQKTLFLHTKNGRPPTVDDPTKQLYSNGSIIHLSLPGKRPWPPADNPAYRIPVPHPQQLTLHLLEAQYSLHYD